MPVAPDGARGAGAGRGAHWQSGEVKFENRWTKIDDVPKLAKKDSDLGAYEAQRNRAADTLDGQLNLARWCLHRGLNEQARAHYNQVLSFDADNVEARSQLGFRRVGNAWVAKPELDEMMNEAQRLNKSLAKWLERPRGCGRQATRHEKITWDSFPGRG